MSPEEIYDPIERPKHYHQHPSGVECIQIAEHMTFNLGNAVKYIWRSSQKGNLVEDLKKARWYIDREINRLSVPIRPPVDLNKLSERDLIPQTDRAWTDGHPDAVRASDATVRRRGEDDVVWVPLPELEQQIRAADERENKNERY